MNQRDAAKILQLNGEINPAIVKTAYRKLSMVFHPDRNPAGLEMMKLVNAAYLALKDITRDIDVTENADTYGTHANYSEAINAALNAIINLGLKIEICGAWIWVSGNTKPHKEILKAAGFYWNAKKVMWYFRPADYRSYNKGKWSMEQIRDAYGSDEIKNRQFTQLYNV